MEMQSVVSSNISSVGYDTTNNTLSVEFKSGKIYTYPDISPETYQSLLEASSVGRFIRQFILGK